jgi:putative Mn2+ efflux pump MntP
MTFATLVLIALGLSMDAFGASISRGASITPHALLPDILKAGSIFGAFSALAPLIGWTIGSVFYTLIAPYDHWIAFVLLSAIGLLMMRDGWTDVAKDTVAYGDQLLVIIIAAIATSIDASVVGITLPAFRVNVLMAAGVIGFMTFLASILGSLAGRAAGERLGRRAEVLGGIILIAIGAKIVIEHIYFAPDAA